MTSRNGSDAQQPGRVGFAITLTQRSVAEYFDDRGPQLAASIAYHVLFSLFPLAIVLAAAFAIVVQLTGLRGDVVDTIVSQVPLSASGTSQLRRLLEGATSGYSALGLLGVVGLVWAASGMMGAVRVALNGAWDVEQARPYLKGKLVDLGLVLVVALGGIASVSATIAVRTLSGLNTAGLSWLLGILFPLVVAAVTIFSLYRWIPDARVDTSPTWMVAASVAVAFVIAENLFALYVSNFANYNAVYGSLGTVIAFMFFVYLSSSLFLLGAEVASEWPRLRRAYARGEVEEGPPFSVQVKQFAKGLWVRERTRETEREERRAEGPTGTRSGR